MFWDRVAGIYDLVVTLKMGKVNRRICEEIGKHLEAEDEVLECACGFRVIIITVANSQVNIRVLELLPKFKTKEMSCRCTV